VVNFREKASTDSKAIGQISNGTIVSITGIDGEWYKIKHNNKEGYVHSEYIKIVVSGVTSRSGASLSKAQKVVQYAKDNLGKKYVWGATGPNSFDCSGLVQYVYKKVGINLNRVSRDQATQGVAVSKSNLQPGDLVFFNGINSSAGSTYISHVGIYIGNGEFIHASNPTRGVVKDSLNSDYYKKHYVKARRIIR
jgi:cell wall-associated NlpC family hydrolase